MPLICTPLIGANWEKISGELDNVLQKQPDILEWRADFFAHICDSGQVLNTAEGIRQKAGNLPIIFTLRSQREGGQSVPLSESDIVNLYEAVCKTRTMDLVDYELVNPKENIRRVRRTSHDYDAKMIMSYHNFSFTPGLDIINMKFMEAKEMGADAAKVAVMSNSLQDVLTLLGVTLEARNRVNIPVITMSMGEYGSLTRMFGGAFGSSVTFAVGENSSAPGQLPIEDLRTVLAVVGRSIGSK